jgi:predicted nucleic acid-binding protein
VIVPYDYAVCEAYGQIKASLSKGRTIADNDLWIAACAIRHSVPLVTHNRKHFDEIRGLIVISEQRVEKEINSQASLDLKETDASSEQKQPS